MVCVCVCINVLPCHIREVWLKKTLHILILSGFSGGPCDLEQYWIANKHHHGLRACVPYLFSQEDKQNCITFLKVLLVVVKLNMTAAVPWSGSADCDTT